MNGPLPPRPRARRARPGRPDPDGARLAAAGRAPHRDQGRLQRGRLRRLHRGGRAARGRPARLPRGQRLHPVRGDPRRLPAAHGRGPEGAGRAAAPGAAGDGRLPRLAVRLLHAGLRDVDVRADPRRPTRCRTRPRSTTRWPAISAAAPATRRSCARCSSACSQRPARRRDRGVAAETLARGWTRWPTRRRSWSATAAPVHRPGDASTPWPRSCWPSPRPPSSPAAPMSACG